MVTPRQMWFKHWPQHCPFWYSKKHTCTESRKKQDEGKADRNNDCLGGYLIISFLLVPLIYFLLPSESKPTTNHFPTLYFLRFSLQRTISFDPRSIPERKPCPATEWEWVLVVRVTPGCITSWKLTGCSWGFLNRSETKGRELEWLDTGFGFSKGHKGTILYIFHFFWFLCLSSCPERIYSYKLLPRCQDESNQNFSSKC